MNMMKQFQGYRAISEKNNIFFCFGRCKGLFHVHFGSLSSLSSLCEAIERFFMDFNSNLMNFMNLYEVGEFKRNFGKCASGCAVVVKINEVVMKDVLHNFIKRKVV